ncbi:MAG: hypothetical protein Q8N57_01555 [bacterium]|nr:hypothetical protein [bacterium]
MKTLVILFVLLIGIGAQAQEKKEKKLKPIFSLEFEMISAGWPVGNKTGINVQVREAPDYLRTVPIHRDDPLAGQIIYLPDKPIDKQIIGNWENYSNNFTFKLWFFSTIGIGVGGRKEGGAINTGDIEGSYKNGERYFGLVDYNYSSPNWGAAYAQYYFKTYQTSEWPKDKVRLLIEMKSPSFSLKKSGPLEINAFAGYEPERQNVSVFAINGWNRRSNFETHKSYELGRIRDFGHWYAGVNLQLKQLKNFDRLSGYAVDPNKEKRAAYYIGLRFYMDKSIVGQEITVAGQDARFSFLEKKSPFFFCFGHFYFILNIW